MQMFRGRFLFPVFDDARQKIGETHRSKDQPRIGRFEASKAEQIVDQRLQARRMSRLLR